MTVKVSVPSLTTFSLHPPRVLALRSALLVLQNGMHYFTQQYFFYCFRVLVGVFFSKSLNLRQIERCVCFRRNLSA